MITFDAVELEKTPANDRGSITQTLSSYAAGLSGFFTRTGAQTFSFRAHVVSETSVGLCWFFCLIEYCRFSAKMAKHPLARLLAY